VSLRHDQARPTPVVCVVLTDGSLTELYILPCQLCEQGMYQDQIAVLAAGALEKMGSKSCDGGY
jgi:hypothetical protein